MLLSAVLPLRRSTAVVIASARSGRVTSIVATTAVGAIGSEAPRRVWSRSAMAAASAAGTGGWRPVLRIAEGVLRQGQAGQSGDVERRPGRRRDVVGRGKRGDGDRLRPLGRQPRQRHRRGGIGGDGGADGTRRRRNRRRRRRRGRQIGGDLGVAGGFVVDRGVGDQHLLLFLTSSITGELAKLATLVSGVSPAMRAL